MHRPFSLLCSARVQANLGVVGRYDYGPVSVHVIDAARFYVQLMETIFDFEAIRGLLRRPDFSILYDGLHGGTRHDARCTRHDRSILSVCRQSR
jgi:phosphoglucomutase